MFYSSNVALDRFQYDKKKHNDAVEVVRTFCDKNQPESVQYILTSYQSDCQNVCQIHSAILVRLISISNEIFRSIGYYFDCKARYIIDSFLNRMFNRNGIYTCVLRLHSHKKKSRQPLSIYKCRIVSDDVHHRPNLYDFLLLRNTNVCLFPSFLPQSKTPESREFVIKDTSNIIQILKPSSSRSPLIFMFSLICVLVHESVRRKENTNSIKEILEKFFLLLCRQPSIKKTKKDRRIIQSLLELKTINVCQDITAYPVSRLSLTYILDKESSGSLSESRMNNELMRLSTLSNFPVHGISLIRLAEAGFFFEGNGDELVCYCCGIRLNGWRADSNAADIHQKYSPNCLHILEKKSDQVELLSSRNSITSDGITDHRHAEVFNGETTCEQIMCTDARHDDSLISLLISTSQNAAQFQSNMQGSIFNNTASTFPSQQSERISPNVTNHMSSSMSMMESQSRGQQYPDSNSSWTF
ncbi:XIAP [Mytilus coruscus]|uniref:XIAP n=1 Tax=Mytilus coruscus TaxID=42192 RepID=A0A6J8CJA0_MYTCO|nr:XIAP [Mytilus coruscus]